MKTFKKLASVVALLAGLGVAQQASAAIQMTLTDGTNTVVIDDNMAGDFNPAIGVITFLGPVGCFGINVSTGLGDAQAIGFTGIDLNSINTAQCAAPPWPASATTPCALPSTPMRCTMRWLPTRWAPMPSTS